MRKSSDFSEFRVKIGPMASPGDFGANGAFMVPHPRIKGTFFYCWVSDQMGWEHVSVTMFNRTKSGNHEIHRCPTWEEMSFVKTAFWSDEEAVIQFHPPKDQHVNVHPYCLHLWAPTLSRLTLPPTDLVGFNFPEDPSDQLTTTNK